MKSVFLLQHVRELDGDEDVKIIGIYSSKMKAEQIIKEYIKLPGFKDYPDSFCIDEYEIDQNNWGKGFITV